MAGSTRFHWKYLIAWVILGVVIATIFVLPAKMPSGVNSFEAFLIVSLMPSIYGFLGMLFDGGLRHGWRFREIEHRPLVWYIYPVIGLADIIFSLTLGYLIWVITSPFRSKK